MLINGSPRAPHSNSKRYAEYFQKKSKLPTKYINISKYNHSEIINELSNSTDVVFVFPLYVDGIPSTLLNFLKTLEKSTVTKKAVISVLVNCGFIEHQQNDVAIEMIKIFCNQHGYEFGSVLSIGGGQAVLDTPFKRLAYRKIGIFTKSICEKKYKKIEFTMPMTKRMYITASTKYWIKYGFKNGVTKEQMAIMDIE